MVNTLANHGYLPRDGLAITLQDLLTGFTDGINLDPSATLLVGTKALETSTTGDNSSFNLDDLSRHGIIEHDGSLSRADIYFGDNHSFNSTIWETVASYFTEDTIDVKTAARARAARLADAAKENPEFNLTSSGVNFSLIESALYLSVFNNGSSATAVTEWVKVMFQHERLPFEEGFTRPESIVSTAGILAKQAEVAAASIGA
ncbi:putative chloroperoxidase-like protein [Diaporthe ampelina]|uniref:Putative chloroperoxidase-like protein n=1 Tax=Diaporthe ampelina TaxID=1214573 RepID=A0A0G2FQS4_9PEZI|nr:putative chloroperoxidase-like protein [Diaporthe ampelina]